MTADTTASPSGAEPRAFVLLKSRRRLDLLNPDPHAWTDDDLAAGLSRTMRWGGASRWEHPLSVAQHSLTALTIREADGALTPGEALRELLHDATEFMLGWDCITPLKAQLGEPFRALDARLQSAIDTRYRLPEWTPRLTRSTSAPTGLPPRPKLSMRLFIERFNALERTHQSALRILFPYLSPFPTLDGAEHHVES